MNSRTPHRLVDSAHLGRVALLTTLAACAGSDGTNPEPVPGPPASIHFVSGGGQGDTAIAMLSAPLVVEVRDSSGRPVRNAAVSFEAPSVRRTVYSQESSASFCSSGLRGRCVGYAYGDSAVGGRVAVFVALGPVAGTFLFRARVPGTTLSDTMTVSVRPGAPARLSVAPRDSSAYAGNSYRVAGRVFDQYGNERNGEVVTFAGSGPAASIAGDGVYHADAVGRAFALARSGPLVDTAWITVPPHGTIAALEPGAPTSAKVVKVELDGSGFKRLTTYRGTSSGNAPDWLSGSEIGFADAGDNAQRIVVVDTLGTTRRLTAPDTPTYSEGSVAGSLGGVVYFDAWGGGDYGTALWKVTSIGGMPVRIGPNPHAGANAWQAAPAPDGQRLVYLDVNRGGLSLLDVATGVPTPLNIAASTPRWSPSGEWIVFGANGTLHLLHPDGTGLTDVAAARPFAPRADWSPDGKWLIARSASRLELIEVSTGRILPLGWGSAFIAPSFRRE